MADEPSKAELEAAHCWEEDDRVPRRPEMTAFRRRARLHQARWREANGHPIGSQPMRPRQGVPVRPVGSRLPLDYAQATGANFVTAAAHDAAKARLANKESHQVLDGQRLWADLLWKRTLCLNLFGDLAADLGRADRAVHAWWPDTPGTPGTGEVRFLHSPGRLDSAYLGNLVTFDGAFVLDLGDGSRGIVALDVEYHDRCRRLLPKPIRLPRYVEVMERSGLFKPDALPAVNGTDLLLMWLQHLLVQSMLQHPSGTWRWGRFVVVHPAGNTDYADACARYRALLVDPSSFASITVEQLLDSGALPKTTVKAVRARYLPG